MDINEHIDSPNLLPEQQDSEDSSTISENISENKITSETAPESFDNGDNIITSDSLDGPLEAEENEDMISKAVESNVIEDVVDTSFQRIQELDSNAECITNSTNINETNERTSIDTIEQENTITSSLEESNSLPSAMDIRPLTEFHDDSRINLKTYDDPIVAEESRMVQEVQSETDISKVTENTDIKENTKEGKEENSEVIIPPEPSGLQDDTPITNGDVEMTAAEPLDQPIFWPYKLSDEFLKNDSLSRIATTIKDEFRGRNLKGCKWAPDGSCLLSNSDDNILRLYNLPQCVYQIEDWNAIKTLEEDTSWIPALSIREGGQIYDYSWFPLMNSSDPTSACLLSTACDGPVHLRDAFTGSLRASYLAYNQFDEVTTAYSVAFDPYGEYIYCGFNQTVRIFNITRPGRECTTRVLKHKVLPDLCQKGIISCIAVNPTLNGVYACGSYRRTVGLYLEDGSVLCILEGHLGGVTHLSFSHDGSKLFTGGRKDSRLICWDMRNMGEEYQIFDRVVETNQRIYFEVSRNDRYLISGGSDGCVRLWDLSKAEDKAVNVNVSTDCVNGVSLNPFVPILATASGQRHFPDISEDGDSDDMFVDSAAKVKEAKEIKLWKFT